MLLKEGMLFPKPVTMQIVLFELSLTVYLSSYGENFRSQTTKGIWMARGVNIEPLTIVMDLEGSDGRERGEVTHSF